MTKEQVHEVLSSYVEEFKERIEYHAITYKIMGTDLYESPMWFQLRDKEEGKLMFVSSQKNGIWFSLPIKEGHEDVIRYANYDIIYEFFKEVKYAYLKENHPTVYSQIK